MPHDYIHIIDKPKTRPHCPICNSDTLITLSDGTYCMDEWCNYYAQSKQPTNEPVK